MSHSPPLVAALVFVPAAAVSLGASTVLVNRLERVCARLATPEAVLGLVVALAADGPEIVSAVAALLSGQREVGVGVVVGSNAFNLAALLGLAAIVARRIMLHRRVVVLEGAVALWMAVLSIAVVRTILPPAAALGLARLVLAPYVAISAVNPRERHRLPLPRAWREWLAGAVSEEELEIADALKARPGRPADAAVAVLALGVVIAASAAMERSAAAIGVALSIPAAVTGGLVLAAVTSLPNAVAAVYLATRDRASATLSQALNSNSLNVLAGLLVPAVLLGLGAPSTATSVTAAWYLGLTVLAVALAFRYRGLARGTGIVIMLAYLALLPVLIGLG